MHSSVSELILQKLPPAAVNMPALRTSLDQRCYQSIEKTKSKKLDRNLNFKFPSAANLELDKLN